MGIINMLSELFQRESDTVVNGWIGGAKTYGPGAEGRHYLSVSCTDLAIRYDTQRFGKRLPVLQSQVTWPSGDARITVSNTLGPSNFAPLSDGKFARMVQRDVALTGDLPMNSDSVNVVVGLLAAPGGSLLQRATEFLGNLASLTQVPQLTAAAPVAAKVVEGVDKLLGNDETTGLIALQISIQADELKEGYLVVTDWPSKEGALADLGVRGSRLLMLDPRKVEWVPATGFSYVLLKIQISPSKPERWRELGSISDLAKDAVKQLSLARSAEDVAAAGSAVLFATSSVQFEPNLTVEDRGIAADEIEKMWNKERARRNKVLSTDDPVDAMSHDGIADEVIEDFPAPIERKRVDRSLTRELMGEADAVSGRLKKMRARSSGRG